MKRRTALYEVGPSRPAGFRHGLTGHLSRGFPEHVHQGSRPAPSHPESGPNTMFILIHAAGDLMCRIAPDIDLIARSDEISVLSLRPRLAR